MPEVIYKADADLFFQGFWFLPTRYPYAMCHSSLGPLHQKVPQAAAFLTKVSDLFNTKYPVMSKAEIKLLV